MKIKPLGSNILLTKKYESNKSKTGFVMPQSKDSETQLGKVEGVGKDVEGIKVGDTVAFANFSGAEIDKYLLISSHDILGIVENE